MSKKNLWLIIILFGLAGCGNDLLGLKSNEEKLDGQRISVLKLQGDLVPDKTLDSIKVNIPQPESNSTWANSNGSQYDYPDNIIYDGPKEQIKSARVISWSRNSYYLTATPVIANNQIFIMNGIGSVFAYDKDNLRKELWKKHLAPIDEKEETIGGGAAYHDGNLFVTSGHKDVVALNSANGKELWRYSLNNIARAAPIVQSDKLFVVTIDNTLYALDIRDGSLLWMHEGAQESIGVFGAASIAANWDVIIAPHSSGQLHALDLNSGKEFWSVNLAFNSTSLSASAFSDIDVTPVIRDGRVYVAGNMGLLYNISLHDGELAWRKEIKGIKSIWVAGEFLYVINSNNELLCIYNKTGGIKWVKTLFDQKPGTKKIEASVYGPVLAGDKLVVVTSNGKLLLVSPADGQIISEKKVPTNIHLIPAIAGDNLYLLSNDGSLSIL